MRILGWVAMVGIWIAATRPVLAHSITQRVGGYQDNTGKTRERVGLDATVTGQGGWRDMTSSSVACVVTRDSFADNQYSEDEYSQEVYGSSRRVNDAVSIIATQTWEKITDTRVMGSYSSDQKVRTRSFAAGMSQWYAHETIRIGYDVSRTVVEQPLYQVLDYDSQEIGNPSIVSSVGMTASVRHLATPTTLMDYTLSHIDLENRPAQNTGTVAARQFFPGADAAVHLAVSRADNRGYITTETNYGQVDAWIYDTAYLQNLWRGGRSRVAYRYYKEDEVTRAYEDRLQLGSDTVTVALSQDIDKKAIENIGVPLTLDVAASRYANNAGIDAKTLELGVTAQF